MTATSRSCAAGSMATGARRARRQTRVQRDSAPAPSRRAVSRTTWRPRRGPRSRCRPARLRAADGVAADEARVVADRVAHCPLRRAHVRDGARRRCGVEYVSYDARQSATGTATRARSASRRASPSDATGSTAPRSPASSRTAGSSSHPTTAPTRRLGARREPPRPRSVPSRRRLGACPSGAHAERISSATRKARSSDWRPFRRGSQSVS